MKFFETIRFLLYPFLFYVSSANEVTSFNSRPIIGILTEPVDAAELEIPLYPKQSSFSLASSYIAASYVKLIETAGARAIPIHYEASKSELKALFSQLNGIILPGGGDLLESDKSTFFKAGEALWEYIQDNPTYPVFGICLGYEFITALAAEDISVLLGSGRFKSANRALNVKLEKGIDGSDFLKYVSADENLVNALGSQKITYNEHEHGITPKQFKKYENLVSNFDILGTSKDDNGKEFIAILEGKSKGKYPNIVGTQFHPEKILFEWHYGSNFPKSNEAVRFSQSLINSFVEKTRLNANRFEASPYQESEYIIENYLKILNPGDQYFQEMYLFSYPDQKEISDQYAEKNGNNLRGNRYIID